MKKYQADDLDIYAQANIKYKKQNNKRTQKTITNPSVYSTCTFIYSDKDKASYRFTFATCPASVFIG